MKVFVTTTLAAVWLAATGPATAQQAPPPQPTHSAPSQDAAYAEGEVRKVDKAAGRITVKHGEIKSLDMPAMTMVFGVKEPTMLEQVKAGDKIRFTAAVDGGRFTLTEIQPLK